LVVGWTSRAHELWSAVEIGYRGEGKVAKVPKPGDKNAATLADDEFYRKHPDRKSKPLTFSLADTRLRREWLEIYKSHGGKVRLQVPVGAGSRKTTLAECMKSEKKHREVYVYVVHMKSPDPWGHAGLIVQQKDGTYIRYSQRAANSNLHGFDRWKYFTWQLEVVVGQRKGKDAVALAAGGKIIRIPTEHPDDVQTAVDNYIRDKSHYHLITNNCADFVNDVLNQAPDISIPDDTVPTDYFTELEKLYPDCVLVK
jgi:hypothetical protein